MGAVSLTDGTGPDQATVPNVPGCANRPNVGQFLTNTPYPPPAPMHDKDSFELAMPSPAGNSRSSSVRVWPVTLGLLKTMRPRQWVKNLFVLLPMVFAKSLLDATSVSRAILAFACFCAVSSSVYVMNDLGDVAQDREHPKKRFRPIAAGVVPESVARWFGLALGASAIVASSFLGARAMAAIVAYLVLNVAYTYKLKHVAYLDVLSIAAGFELRVLGGAFAIHVLPETYLVVVTFTLAAFLGFGKRMHELQQGEAAGKQRAVLERYDERPLEALLYLNAVATIAAYVAGSLDARNRAYFGSNHLVYTSAFAAFGLFRFARIVTTRPDAESPTEEMLEDRWFLLNLAAWAVAVFLVVYLGR